AACTIGDFLYLAHDSYVNDNDPLDLYGNDLIISKCIMNEKDQIVVLDEYRLVDVMDRSSHHPVEMNWFTHHDGNPRLLLSYSAEHEREDYKENKGGGVLVFDPENPHKIHHLHRSDDYGFSFRAIHGSMRAKRQEAQGNIKDNSRIQVIYNHFVDGHWDGLTWYGDRGDFHFETYAVDDDNYPLISKGKILLEAKDRHPDEWNRMNLGLTSMLESMKDENNVYDPLMFQQMIWMFYNDKDGHIRGGKFKSDFWRYIPQSELVSLDLADTLSYGPEIKDTWTMLGIVEGAPPMAVDWEAWHNSYGDFPEHPSSFSYDREFEIEITKSKEQKYSGFIGFTAGGKKVNGSLKYTATLIRESSNRKIKTQGNEIELVLNKESQSQGAIFYLVPNILRITYGVFPWWEKDYSLTTASQLNYRFITTDYSIVRKDVLLSDAPFHLDPGYINSPELERWIMAEDNNRSWLQNNAGRAETIDISWTRPQPGSKGYIVSKNEKSIASTHEHEVEFDVNIAKPHVFEFEFGGSVSWASKIEVTTSLAESMHFSYEKLVEQSSPLLSHIKTKALIFYDNSNPSLYFTRFLKENENPWYIGYLVTELAHEGGENLAQMSTASIQQTSQHSFSVYPNPSDGKRLLISGLDAGCTGTISIFGMNGQAPIRSFKLDQQGNGTLVLEFEAPLASGLYMVKYLTPENIPIIGKVLVY
ncbi:MAG: T9SS type A sorting domain-containing protein, partial [Prolixibacteraceae bacterium]|nr:T9SS type A sorting domain-containing protein [Prolixibacteraceae bacterium]